ncbi:N-acetyltransferase [Aurantiacibacter xanthus]|uniref:N-acetyltransferase n=1 Tax=Aurantiacibacter xanthus TaxID=1784712 RepID=A0A3A1PCL1_9SPHN|nr:N-acetyltransferase [Aurantiacibacter xanthus]RIV91516.1 N-acetyltransferase [Aurantiacibacter xanthus]
MVDSLASTTLVPLSAVDPSLVEQLLDRAFGPDRHERTAYKVREGTEWLPALSFAAIDEQELLVGTIQVYPVALTDEEGRRHPMLMVGPVAVVPERQSEGFGTTLMLAMASSLDPETALPQVLIGDAPYYGRFGFVAAPTQGWTIAGPYDKDRLLVRAPNVAVLPEKGTLGPWIG